MAHSDPGQSRPQTPQREQQPAAPAGKDDPHFAPESGDKPDAATPGNAGQPERGAPSR